MAKDNLDKTAKLGHGYSSGHPMPGSLLSEFFFSLDLVNLVYTTTTETSKNSCKYRLSIWFYYIENDMKIDGEER